MEFNNKKLEKTSKVVNYLIAFALCIFLIALTNNIIDDIGDWKEPPRVEQFINNELIAQHKVETEKISTQSRLKQEKIFSVKNTIKVVNNNYENAKKSFDNWIEARKTVGSPTEDKEVLSRANELDNYYKTQQEWQQELTKLESENQSLIEQMRYADSTLAKERIRAEKERSNAIEKYQLKVFLYRLLFILPILLLGIYFIMKFRKHKYWPLFLGYVMFSFYAFFFGLVPYLPSYGGYVRYSVGIILSIVFGIYAINRIRSFIEQKKNELKVSTTERSKKVQIETAEKALDNHMCPSCGKDFIVKRWDLLTNKTDKIEVFGAVTNFCRFCGLQLFKKCSQCETDNFAHLPFCSHCGDSLSEKE